MKAGGLAGGGGAGEAASLTGSPLPEDLLLFLGVAPTSLAWELVGVEATNPHLLASPSFLPSMATASVQSSVLRTPFPFPCPDAGLLSARQDKAETSARRPWLEALLP